jgi:hypothetical protein
VIYANNAYITANLALDTCNIAFETSDIALNVAQAALTNVNSAVEYTETLLSVVPPLFDFANNAANTAFAAYEAANNALETAENANTLATSANTLANSALFIATDANNLATFSSNLANLAIQNIFQIQDDTISSNTVYPALLLETTGVPNRVYVSSTKLSYNVETGQISATNFNSLSDINKKNNIITLENALNSVMNLRGVSFTWKDTHEKAIGVIAQEIETVVPEVVSTNEKGEKSVSYGNIVGLLIQAIKEMKKEIDDLKNIINKK